MKVASFNVRGTVEQSARWKRAAELAAALLRNESGAFKLGERHQAESE